MRVISGVLLLLLLAGGYWLGQEGRYIPIANQAAKLQRDLSRDITKRIEKSAGSPPERSLPARKLPEKVAASDLDGAKGITRYEKMLCDLANEEREKQGLPRLEIDAGLAEVARGHSREMMEKGYFAHESPTEKWRTPMDRYVDEYGQSPHLVAENIYMFQRTPSTYTLQESDFRRAHTGWMNSPGHRANILRASPMGGPTHIGVGIVVRKGGFWATQMFARH
jgi:uncharacterized protein YkwD